MYHLEGQMTIYVERTFVALTVRSHKCNAVVSDGTNDFQTCNCHRVVEWQKTSWWDSMHAECVFTSILIA